MQFQPGHVNSPEVRKKISLANKGKVRTPEQRENYKRAAHNRFKGPDNNGWKGGRKKSPNGYVLIWRPSHPHVMRGGYVYEHRLVMESILGRYLESKEEVHHINSLRDDNGPGNLRLFSTRAKHVSFERKRKPGPLIQEYPDAAKDAKKGEVTR